MVLRMTAGGCVSMCVLICFIDARPVAGMQQTTAHAGTRAPRAPRALPLFDPSWREGDTWRVKFTVPVERRLMVGPGFEPQPALEEDIYAYTVLPELPDPNFPGMTVVKVNVHSEDGYGDWLLTLDRSSVVLLDVSEVIEARDSIRHLSPFIAESWMSKLNQYSLQIIHDFPRLAGFDSSRLIEAEQTGTPNFTQTEAYTVIPGGRLRATVALVRVDPVSTAEHTTRFVWISGDKWWKSATVTLDGEVEVSAVLIP